MKYLIFLLLFSTYLFSQTATYEFITEPIDLIENYYDYMPGSYNGLPMQIEEDGSLYLAFHAKETTQSTRRIYYAYIDENGILQNCDFLGTNDLHEGYAGIDLDPVTGDPFIAWHVNLYPSSADLEIVTTYDIYHLGIFGNWLEPFVIIDDNTPSANAPNDEFIWPEVHVGPSPLPGKRRVYIIGKNSDHSITGEYSENVLADAEYVPNKRDEIDIVITEAKSRDDYIQNPAIK